ncbi:hypothetical protein [Actinopolyspora halophila]|uniref:hypothetical protein n=1 Tax=Actinopolyspora halophila TaxID=1850 RepID=UPI00036CE3ED|nr:hypothetical protein [Actinopolyspora halophila]
MNHPRATRQDHEQFCRTEDWDRVRDARGRTGTHHITYELALHDGRILRTRISHPVDRSTYGAGLWQHILRDQLEVDETQFWSCVHEGNPPPRSGPEPQAETLPADLVHLLINRVGLADSEIATMNKDEAIARLQRYWTEGQ